MRNLKLVYAIKKRFPNINPKLFEVAVNVSQNISDLLNNSIGELFNSFKVTNCEYLFLNNEVCIATEGGEVIVINLEHIEKGYEVVTYCSDGVEVMSWSPDQEVITFITKSKKVVVMTSTYEPINETDLNDTSFGEKEFITVGWGKKETQFHGSEGKQAAKQKLEFVAPTNGDVVDQTVNVSWRGDSELFVVSYVGENGRMFKVFNKEGILQYTSERLNGLGTCIAWKPTGSVIAVPHKLPNKSTIALFEKNGLRHREIILPFNFDDESIFKLAWSGDSDILSIQTEYDNKSRLYVYTVCNYHWYLKQFLKFGCKILHLTWSNDLNEEKTLHVLLENGSHIIYKWCYTICYSDGDTINNQSIVSVIDGRNILLTDFRNTVIPPPMSNQIIENSAYVHSCSFLKYPKNEEDINKLLIFDTDNEIKIFNIQFENFQFGKKLKSTNLNLCLKIDQEITELSSIPLNMNQLLWLNDDSIVFYEIYDQDENYCKIYLVKFENDSVKITHFIKISQIIGSLTELNSDTFLFHTKNKDVFSIKIINNNKLDEPKLFTILPEYCERIKAIQTDIDNFKIVAHKLNQNLYVNNVKISSDVTSFFITKKYIIFTQLSCLKFWKISDNLIIDERKIERGGKLIVIVPLDSRTIIQMPRGNLEAISPRVLLLDTIGELLDQLQYKKCMEILRKNRINLNIMFDHNPKIFIENIDKFLNDLEDNCEWINLFLNDLKNEDFTKTFYSSNYSLSSLKDTINYPKDYSVSEKINYVCKILSEKMIKKDYIKFLLPIITSYVKIDNLEKALEIIWTEKKKEMSQLQNTKIHQSLIQYSENKTKSEEALKYLLYLTDVNDLYNVALGMYNFNLVLFIASKSQKDPKEYIPYLNNLNNLEVNYRKFKIDEHLKRYERALEHISKCKDDDKFEECLKFVQIHKLYQKALMEFKDNDERYKKIALCFADYLRSNSKHEEASVMYERGGDLQQAILSAKHVLDLQRCLMLTKSLTPNDSEQLCNISLSLIPSLQEHGKHNDAFYLLKNFVGDFHKAIECLLNGRLYSKAIFEAKMNEPELLNSIISSHLLQYKDILYENISTDKNLFVTYKNRLLTVRIEKSKKVSEHYEDGVDECDILSDTSLNSTRFSGSSKGSGKTFRSSKNRRKHERKLLSLKEGNPFEDIALIDAIYNHIMKIINQQLHIRDVCKALIEIKCDKDGEKIQTKFHNLIKIIKNSLDEIWIPEITTAQQYLGGPNIDYTQLQNEQRYALINPQKRFKPQLDIIDWEFEILK